MLPGFEALGAASALLHVIFFAEGLVSQYKLAYNGNHTPDDDLEDRAKQMIDASLRVQSHCKAIGSPMKEAETKLCDVAGECHAIAEKLASEVHNITGIQSKRKMSKSLLATYLSLKHRKSLKRLEASLQNHKQLMETQLLFRLCTRTEAAELEQSQNFRSLSTDTRCLVSQIAQGCTIIEDLVKAEHDETRRLVRQEAQTTKELVSRNISTVLSSKREREATASKRENLLQSLKYPEMNERFNDVIDPQDATFSRIFKSYENISGRENFREEISGESISGERTSDDDISLAKETVHAIDQAWARLVYWLKSNNSIFWIRGKPGSGKSTLLKFITSHPHTNALLSRWNADAQIISHFFWKIGSAPQNSAKGMMGSLLYSILRKQPGISDQVLNTFTELSDKSFYNDWSVRELENVLIHILETPCPPICLFIDGLDEVSDKEGPDKVMNLITKLKEYSHVKLCVSSRPETSILGCLEAMSVAIIRLEELTEPDMYLYAHGQLNLASADCDIQASAIMELGHELVWRAEGVFLWLFLATRSVTSGIRQKDHIDEIFSRLHQLPSDLDKLYQEMWKRLNRNDPIYRSSAARYFNILLYRGFLTTTYTKNREGPHILFNDPSVADLASFGLSEKQIMFLPVSKNLSRDTFQKICERTVHDIQCRCAGLIEVKEMSHRMQSELGIQNDKSQLCYTMMRPVRFIHRSARDFLVDTNLGQKIRSYDRSSTDELALGCLRAAISKAHVLTKELGGHVDVRSILYHLHQLLRESSVERQQINLEILPIIREVYERGSLLYRRYAQVHPLPPMRVTFLMLVAGYNCIEDYLILSISQQSLLEVNAALYGACAGTMETTSQIVPINVTPWGLINAALGVGANPHLLWSFPNLNNKYHLMEHSAFSVFLSRAFDFTERDREDNSLAEKVLGTAATMASSCPNSRQKFLLAMSLGDRGFLILPHLMDLTYQRYPGHIVLEVDLRFLLQQVFALYTTGTITEANKDLERLDPARWSTDDSAIVRLVTDRAPGRSDVAMFKPLNQTPFKEIMDSLFLDYTSYNGAFKRDGSICDEIYHRISELLTDPCAVEEVDYDSELDALAAAGIGLRICKGLEAT